MRSPPFPNRQSREATTAIKTKDPINHEQDMCFYKRNRITQINHTAAVSAHADGISDFSYDKASQLTDAEHALPARPDGNLQYDANGNRIGSGYQNSTGNLTVEDADYTYSYNWQGNRTTKTSKADGSYQQFIFDHRNRLERIVSRDANGDYIGRVDYHYDTFNRMVRRQDRSDANTVIDNYFAGYDGINPTLEFEKVGYGDAARQDLQHRYWWGPQVDQLFADEQISDVSQVGEVLWPLPDHLGTIRDIAKFDGTSFEIVNHRTYVLRAELWSHFWPN